MDNSLVSIIIPVYGVERYLDTCINSVLGQTYKNIEIILVDDCSPDSCPVICDRFSRQDSRIRVIHKKENQGLGFARNTGLEAANGEFIYFIDSDDYIESNLIEKAVSAFETNTEMVIFGINRVHEDKNGNVKKIEKLTPERAESETRKETADIFAMLNRSKAFPFAWNKLYRKAFLDKCGTKFEKTKLIEDFLFNIDLFSKASYIKVLSDNLYNYRKPSHETLVSAYAPEYFELCKRKYSLEKEYLRTVNAETEDNLQLIYFSYVKHLISVFIKNSSKKAKLSLKEQNQKIKAALEDESTQAVLNKYLPTGMIMKLFAFFFKKKLSLFCLAAVILGSKFI